MKIKNFKYVLSLFVGLSVFLGGLGLCSGAGCAGQYLECPEAGCYLKDQDGNCICVSDDEYQTCSDPIIPELPTPPTPPTSPAGQGTPQCENLPDGSGNCLAGYRDVGGCCELVCPLTGRYLSGSDPDPNNCIECTGDTVPNANHTKCVCDSSKKCCGVQLNTVVPFIGDCIEMNTNSSNPDTTSVTSVTAFPILMQGLMKLLMSAIMIFSFMMVIIAGLSITTGAFGGNGFTKGKTILKNVIISLILLGCSGLILSLINPSFFGG